MEFGLKSRAGQSAVASQEGMYEGGISGAISGTFGGLDMHEGDSLGEESERYGIRLRTTDKGLEIISLDLTEKGGTAFLAAGLRTGDIISAIDGEPCVGKGVLSGLWQISSGGGGVGSAVVNVVRVTPSFPRTSRVAFEVSVPRRSVRFEEADTNGSRVLIEDALSQTGDSNWGSTHQSTTHVGPHAYGLSLNDSAARLSCDAYGLMLSPSTELENAQQQNSRDHRTTGPTSLLNAPRAPENLLSRQALNHSYGTPPRSQYDYDVERITSMAYNSQRTLADHNVQRISSKNHAGAYTSQRTNCDDMVGRSPSGIVPDFKDGSYRQTNINVKNTLLKCMSAASEALDKDVDMNDQELKLLKGDVQAQAAYKIASNLADAIKRSQTRLKTWMGETLIMADQIADLNQVCAQVPSWHD